MSQAFTARNYPIKKAPSLIQLLGDKTKKPEPAQHIIEFPGGAIEVSRTSDGYYWAHIIINRGHELGEGNGIRSFRGIVMDSRIDNGREIRQLIDDDEICQIAVLIGRES